jgi:hypothetical protein
MNSNNANIIPDKQIYLLDDLQILLERQIKLACQSNISDVEVLSKQTDCLVKEISQIGILQQASFKGRRKKLQQLYDRLYLVISTQKAETAEHLSCVRKGKKAIETYRKNI